MVATLPISTAPLSNERIFNHVWDAAPIEFQSRIPRATQGNIRDVVASLDSFRPDWNTFIDVLLNGLVLDIYRNNMFENPLAQFKVGRVIENGSWIREVAFNLLKANRYYMRATNVFDMTEPQIMANFHVQNRKDRYDLSISEDLLRQAMFANPQSGLANLINGMLQLPYKSDQVDEYLIMKNLFGEYNKEFGFFNFNVDSVANAAPADKEAVGKDIIQKIRETVLNFQFINRDFNAARIPTNALNPVLFATPRFVSNIDVNVLASAFNMDKADFTGRLVVVDRFDFDANTGEETQAILTSDSWFVAADTRVLATSMYNPKNLVTNHWLHRWGIYSASKFENAVMFSTRPQTPETIIVGDITDVTVELKPRKDGTVPDGVEPGGSIQLVAKVEGTGFVNSAVRWELVGDDGVISSTNTFVTQEGLLSVGSDETSSEFVVRATSVMDDSVFGEITVTVIGNEPTP